ncbi:Spy0128 family protein [Bifidobacterium saguinibicoloris]|uniref:Spy0128 family protein n=1 Tax=Bifidobacterium saguinibicoloris TaxID=2834433 RepID=UPI001C58F806|nr:FctA domain-containing protein [Bifidobacterium saguinibicoloris]MBW3081238.1 LPXTG cell wall anchor domain-containing protein [Bifidobacterium saguinibicoloris]
MRKFADWLAALGEAAQRNGKRITAVVAAAAMLTGVAGVTASAMAATAADGAKNTTSAKTTAAVTTASKAKAGATAAKAAARAAGSGCEYAQHTDAGLPNVCWLDMSAFNAGGRSNSGSQEMSIDLGGGLTMSFTVSYETTNESGMQGVRYVYPQSAPSWPKASFGRFGYTGFTDGFKPVLYQSDNSDGASWSDNTKITISGITVRDGSGTTVNKDYSFVLSDGESTNLDNSRVPERISFASDKTLTKFASFPANGVDAQGNRYTFCDVTEETANSVTCEGVDMNDYQGISLYQTPRPNEVSITLHNASYGSQQGAVFGVIVANARTTVTTVNVKDAADKFTGTVSSEGYTSASTDAVTGSTSSTSATVPMLSEEGKSHTVRFTLEGSNWNRYNVSFACDGDCTPDSTGVKTDGNGNRYIDVSVPSEGSANGVWTVTAKPSLTVSKTWLDPDGNDETTAHKDDTVTVSLGKCADTDTQCANPTAVDGQKDLTLKSGTWSGVFEYLDNGRYKVTETAVNGNASGLAAYDVTYSPDGGIVTVSDGDASVTVTNQRRQDTVTLPAAEFFKARAVIVGRDWKTDPADAFTYVLNGKAGDGRTRAAADCQPMPDGYNVNECNTSIIVTDKNAKSFGDITYTAEGKYTYRINESAQTNHDITQSQAVYRVHVTVDKGTDGKLQATAKVVQVYGDDASKTTPEKVMDDKTGVFIHYLPVSALPLTGGTTGRTWLIGSGALLALAGCSYVVWRKRMTA